jgi:2-polyprenyl-3-methyl-5-hydroxy-6-metoxy-1,4-benzoquinol methylase
MSTISPDREHWSRFAREWIAWARTPNHDAFWAYRQSLIEFIGRGSGEVLDVGCGEGRISRELKALGYRVTACDPVEEFIDAAREFDSAHEYAVSTATELPFETARFDRVVAYNMLMDVEDVPATVKELRRVLRPAGDLMISIVHPIADHGRFEDTEPDAPFVMRGTYSAGSASREPRNATASPCISRAGRSHWRPMRRRWKVRAWRSRRCGSRRLPQATRKSGLGCRYSCG